MKSSSAERPPQETSHSPQAHSPRMYIAANSSSSGSSRKWPRPILQRWHNAPRTRPVRWSWSTTKDPVSPHITHSVACRAAPMRACWSGLTPGILRYSFLYERRHGRHQLSKPDRVFLCGGKYSRLSGFSSPHLRQYVVSSPICASLCSNGCWDRELLLGTSLLDPQTARRSSCGGRRPWVISSLAWR